ncbi:unnamed protein product [Anisakis simplex]|uniref:Superoxide dismutase n=1 Tax=Anisakis simplex TaxID=6269 RepID=A0A0M3J0V2_ANISI|nr:unnamed protein product [Anisakis simplex]
MLFAVYVFYILTRCLFGEGLDTSPNEESRYAIAQIRSARGDIKGFIWFEQKFTPSRHCLIHANITGIPGEHGIAIADWGNMQNGCESMGYTFNPDRISKHVSFNKPMHRVGTLGNIIDGMYEDANNRYVTLFGRNSVIGRGVVIFENRDDGGDMNTIESRFDGNVGKAIACGIIGRVAGPSDRS